MRLYWSFVCVTCGPNCKKFPFWGRFLEKDIGKFEDDDDLSEVEMNLPEWVKKMPHGQVIGTWVGK